MLRARVAGAAARAIIAGAIPPHAYFYFLLALALAVAGVGLLATVRLSGQPLGFAFAFANGALFMLYVMLGYRVARDGGDAGIARLGAAMLVALVTITPPEISAAVPAFAHPSLILAAIEGGLCCSVIPYVCDQSAMARLPRATFALLLSLLPASAAVIGFLVLHQIPTLAEMGGAALVVCRIAIHQEADARPREAGLIA